MTLAKLKVRAAAERRKCWLGGIHHHIRYVIIGCNENSYRCQWVHIAYDDKIDMREDDMETDWSGRVKGLLKAELKKRNVSYRDLAAKLTAMGIPETEPNIANKISRGGFTAVFFVQCLVAIGAHTVRLHEAD